MATALNILSIALRAFFPGGAGNVSLAATAEGVPVPDDRFIVVVTPTWGDANNILILPPPVPGRIVIVAGAAVGGELRSSNPATIGINAGVGANAESAISANMMAIAICESATNWKGFTIASNGTLAALQVAAP